MPDSTLSTLASASALDGTELLYAVQSSADKKATSEQIKTFVLANSTGTGSVVVLSNSPTLVAPTLGNAIATTLNATYSLKVGSNAGSTGAIEIHGGSTGFARIFVSSTAGSTTVRLPVGSGGTGSVVVTDSVGNWSYAAAAGGGDMISSNNLSDVTSASLALSNIGGAPLAGAKNLTGGFTTSSYDAGTASSGTLKPDPFNGGIQHYINAGAHSLAPPDSVSAIILECTNSSGGGGSITTSGFNIVSGDTYTSTANRRHLFYVTKTNSSSQLHVHYVTGT